MSTSGSGRSRGPGRRKGTEAGLACCAEVEERMIMPLVSPLMGGFRRRKHRQKRVINREDRGVEAPTYQEQLRQIGNWM